MQRPATARTLVSEASMTVAAAIERSWNMQINVEQCVPIGPLPKGIEVMDLYIEFHRCLAEC